MARAPRRFRVPLLAAGAVLLPLATACKEDDRAVTHEAGIACPAEFDAGGPPVGFTTDLLPFFAYSCTFADCHGISRQAGLYLGPNFQDGPPDSGAESAVLASLLAASTTAPALPRVKPFDPDHSFLMLKIEGCQNHVGLVCSGGRPEAPCGARMPYVSAELPADKKAMVARWILAGAPGP